MDSRSVAFLEIMAAIAVVGVLAFLIYLIASYTRRSRQSPTSRTGSVAEAHWVELVLGLIVLVTAVALLAWQLFPGALLRPAETGAETDPRSLTFFIVMLAVVGIGVVGFVVFLFARSAENAPRDTAGHGSAVQALQSDAAHAVSARTIETPSATRLVGLLLLGAAFLLLNWVYVEKAQQFALMLYLFYPAGFAVALVLLFDKATRGWSVKTPAESAREWIFCDALLVLLILGFLNLHGSNAGETYASLFWDFLHIALFFFIFWLLDRKVTRYRFLVAYGYLIVLPILLLIWEVIQEVPVPEELSWWSTIWPFFSLAVVFFVLEIITLIAAKETDNQTIPIAKDVAFFVIYAILLIIAIPEAAV